MKKLSAIAIIALAAAMTMTACSEVGTNSDESSAEAETTTAANTDAIQAAIDAGIIDEEIPTDRVPEIKSADNFEYDVIDGNAVITGYTGSDTEVEVPDSIDGTPVTKIGPHAFEAEYDITSIVLPESVTIIGESAFMDCGSLESIDLPESLTEIQRAAFSSCTSLSKITIPASVTIIYEEAFTACEALESLTIENPDLAYWDWGLEELPNVTVYAPEESSAAAWADSMGILG